MNLTFCLFQKFIHLLSKYSLIDVYSLPWMVYWRIKQDINLEKRKDQKEVEIH